MRILIQIGFVVAAWHSTNRTLRAIYTHARAYWISNSRFVVLFAWRFARVRNMNIKRMQRIRWRRRKKRKKNCVQSINFMRRRIYFIICKQLAECILVYLVNCVYRFVRFVFTFGFPLGVTVFRYIFFFRCCFATDSAAATAVDCCHNSSNLKCNARNKSESVEKKKQVGANDGRT